ncbi:MAG: hypothetical protein ACOYX5_04655 [Actinomycetota bacterium]
MPGSQLLLLALSAAVLLVPAALSLLAVERRRHLAALEGTTRRVRMVVAATGAGLGALLISALARAGPVSSVVTAVVVAAALLCWTPLTRSWQGRGVVTWALAVIAAVAMLAWLLFEILTELSGGEMFAPLVSWGLLVAVLLGVRRWLWGVVGARARIATGPGGGGARGVPSGPRSGPEHSAGVPGALAGTVALVVAGVVAVAAVTDGSGLVRWVSPPEAASIGTSEGTDRAVSSETPTPTTQAPTTAAPTSSASGQTTSPSATVAPTSTGTAPAPRPTRSATVAPTRRVPTGVPAGIAADDEPAGGSRAGWSRGPEETGMRGARSPLPWSWTLGSQEGHRGPH